MIAQPSPIADTL